jgi:hypothetical protein
MSVPRHSSSAATMRRSCYNNPDDLMSTVGGLAYIANQGDIYVNLHTTAQTYFGDVRGQFLPVDESDDNDD